MKLINKTELVTLQFTKDELQQLFGFVNELRCVVDFENEIVLGKEFKEFILKLTNECNKN